MRQRGQVQQLLRIFVAQSDRHEGRPLYEAILLEAKRRGLAGATAFRGFMGYGVHSRIHSAKILRIPEDLPVVIEIVDSEANIMAFLPVLDGLIGEGLVVLERVEAIRYLPEAQ